MSFIEPQLTELLLQGLRDAAVDVISRAAIVGFALAIGAAVLQRARRSFRRARRPRRPLPAAA
jgi:hypothetical protein